MRARPIVLVTGFLLAIGGGYWLAKSAAPELVKTPPTVISDRNLRSSTLVDGDEPKFRVGDREGFRSDDEALAAGAISGQRTLMFKSRAELETFLARAGGKIKVLGRLDRLNVLHIGFLNYLNLSDLLNGSEEVGMIFPAFFPENDSVAAQAGAVPVGNKLLDWLGIIDDNSQWGAGVTVAILDTGVSQHSAFGNTVLSIGPAGDPNGHGTAVASQIAGNTDLVPGVAPKATIMSIQIADEAGQSTSFQIAQGILAAIDANISIINISMGSMGDSPVLKAAVNLAIEAGIMIVAPTGNSGLNQVFYPAAYEGVVAVGGVDADGAVLDFSNRGKSVTMAAPALGLNAGYLNDSAMSVSGTSFSSPIVAGMIAATMSQMGLSAQDSWTLISQNLNEAGDAGFDTSYGNGLPDMGRVLASKTRGIYDAAVVSQQLNAAGTELRVTIQNQGTESLINTRLHVATPNGGRDFNSTTLKVGGIETFVVPVYNARESLRFDSTVTVSGGRDIQPNNNRRVETYANPIRK